MSDFSNMKIKYRAIDWNRVLSVLLALTYIVLAFVFVGGEAGLRTIMFVILPLGLIWFSEEMSRWSGTFNFQGLTASTPAFMVKCGGWLLLLLPIIKVSIVYLICR